VRVVPGLSTGGRMFGYRAVPLPQEAGASSKRKPARLEIDPDEAAIVRRIFTDYVGGHSFRTITHALNAENIPFPAKDTKRGPARRGWAASTVRNILLMGWPEFMVHCNRALCRNGDVTTAATRDNAKTATQLPPYSEAVLEAWESLLFEPRRVSRRAHCVSTARPAGAVRRS